MHLRKLWSFLHQSWLFMAFSVGVISGTILALVFRINYFASMWWVAVVVGLFLYAFIRPRAFLVVVMFVAGMILAFFRSSSELIGEYYIQQFVDKTVVVAGTIDGDPETDERGTKLRLVDLRFGENGELGLHGSLYISAYKNYRLARGDVVTLSGKLAAGFGTYAGYMYRPNIVKHQRPEPGDLVLKVRNWFSTRIKKLIPEPEVNLGMSYLLGMKSGLPDDLSENLRIVGLVHIVVASGAHLSILVEIAKKIFGKISRMASLIFSLIFILFFMAMVGWTPSILRAGVMAILTLVTWFVGRKISPIRMIITVMAGTLLINPMFVINLGWLLSFASFGGIMILGPILTRYFYGEKKPGFIGETVITTLSATLMTLPITLYYYGTISLISVVANLLILPTLSYAMGLVFLAGVVSGMPFLPMMVAFVAEKLLEFHILVVNFFGSMGYFLIKIPEGQPWVFLIYLVIVIPLLIGHFKQKMVEFRQVKY